MPPMMRDTVARCRPFLKWPGGKYRLLPHILPHLPQGVRLIEPFVGAGAVFLNASFERCMINDINADLMNLYAFIQSQQRDCLLALKRLFQARYNRPRQYYQLRQCFNRTTDQAEKAVLFLYLNRHGYNGLCRYNRKGQYNVPFGHYINPYFPEREILHFLSMSARIELHCMHFSKLIDEAPSDAVIYCDPPYLPLTKTANFADYYHQGFDWDEQARLVSCAKRAVKRGCIVLISNHDIPAARELYGGARLLSISALRSISCNPQRRKHVKELLAIFN